MAPRGNVFDTQSVSAGINRDSTMDLLSLVAKVQKMACWTWAPVLSAFASSCIFKKIYRFAILESFVTELGLNYTDPNIFSSFLILSLNVRFANDAPMTSAKTHFNNVERDLHLLKARFPSVLDIFKFAAIK